MLEILLLLLGLIVLSYVEAIWLKAVILIILVILILPGLYAMYYGAPFVPSGKRALAKIIKLAKFRKGDVVYELGCGDGRVIRKVAAKGVRQAVGYEYSIPMWVLARLKSILNNRGEKIFFGNFWKQNYKDAEVIICFLLEDSMKDFKRLIWPQLRKGARVLSNCFRIPGVKQRAKEGTVYLYIKK